MCLYPRYLLNPRYKKNNKNGGNIPPMSDPRLKHVPVGCGLCIECRKQKANSWRVRLLEDIKAHKNGKFITLTFNQTSLMHLCAKIKDKDAYRLDNAIATLAVRKFLERWRKTYKTSLRHWFVTELGHEGTEALHIHGIIWTDQSLNQVEKKWQYGHIWKGKYIRCYINGRHQHALINYVNGRTINYIVKYVHKLDVLHKTYQSKVLTSPGIGNLYPKTTNAKLHNQYRDKNTIQAYKTSTGHWVSLPIYWKNKLYTETQREALWLNNLDKQVRWVSGIKIDISKSLKEYERALEWHQDRNVQLGYPPGDGWMKEQQIQAEQTRRMLNYQTKKLKAKHQIVCNAS